MSTVREKKKSNHLRPPRIIFEDDTFIVLDKPSRWIVNEALTTKGQKVLQEWLKKRDYPLAKSREFRSGIVHRLDKETSGLLIVAKTVKAFENLQMQFKMRKVKKTYLALVHGKVSPEEGIIDAPVVRLPWRKDRFGVLPGGREARTEYKLVKQFGDKFSLLELHPHTGRTHQIRIHLKHIGHPVVGDSFYAGRKTARADRRWCNRLFLHASRISFLHPESGKNVDFVSQFPGELGAALESLETKTQSK